MVSVSGLRTVPLFGVEDDVGRLPGEHQLPGLAGVLAPPDAAVGAAHDAA